MQRYKLPINEILVEDRQRQDLGDIAALAESLKQYGLIQPIVVNQNKRLLAGGRRLAAATQLGWSHVDVAFRETLTEDEAFELELEENVRRKDMSWQERCLNIAKIHELKTRRNALEGLSWGVRETGELLGVGKSHTHYCLTIAKELRSNAQSPMWKCESMADAWRLVLRQQEDMALAVLADRQKQLTEEFGQRADSSAALIDYLDPVVEVTQTEKDQARERYLRNPLNPPEGFEEYWLEKQKLNESRLEIRISNRIIHADCREYMMDPDNKGRFDHIITDIPYGHDMDMLEGMANIDTIRDEHEVDYVRTLMQAFFPGAFHCLKPNAYLVTWCDQELWQFMYDLAIGAGFKVQRWPLVWAKTHRCGNNAAQFNFTKSHEIAMVCRKGNATLAQMSDRSVVTCAHDNLCDLLSHPFVKPKEAWKFIYDKVAIRGQLILEPFAGHGSGVISMLEDGLNVIALEKDTEHYNALLENVKQHYYRRLNPNFIFT